MKTIHTSSSEREKVDAIRQLIEGRNNAADVLTLEANQSSTTVTPRVPNSGGVPLLVPTTANAAAEQAAGTMYVSSITKDNFVLTHANNAQTDRTFKYVFLGG